MAYDQIYETPTSTAPDFIGLWESMLNQEDSGVKTRRVTTGVAIGDELRERGFNEKQIANLQKSTGLDFSEGFGYGKTDREKSRILNIVDYLVRSKAAYKDNSYFKGDYEEALGQLRDEVKTFGKADHSLVTEDLKGFAGLSGVEKAAKIRQWQQQNSGKDFASLSLKEQAKVFGLSTKDYTAENQKSMNDFYTSDRFKQYNTAQDIFQSGLESQALAQQRFLDAQKKVSQPGYAQEAINQSFAPAETQLNQYFDPQQGQTYSQAAMEVGAGESALGRTGSDRVAVELARQKGLAMERVGSQKAAAVGQLQQYIDLQQPMDALRYGSGAGQQALGNLDYFRNQLLAPYAQVFPMALQQSQANLMPFSMSRQVPQEPGFMDYAFGGLAAGGQVMGGIGQMYGGLGMYNKYKG